MRQLKRVIFRSLIYIRGILGEPLPKVALLSPAVMLQVLGQDLSTAQHFATENPSAHLHLYGKIEAKENRKMGHVTVLTDDCAISL
jgi:5-(carboxyamino)imidazole ribonucleotide synthase